MILHGRSQSHNNQGVFRSVNDAIAKSRLLPISLSRVVDRRTKDRDPVEAVQLSG